MGLDKAIEHRKKEEIAMKEFDLTVHVHVFLEDDEATEQTVRFLVEEDLRDKGWDADVVEPKHGEWKAHTFIDEDGEEYVGSYECSNCGLFTGPVKLNFCPNCGAKMY